MIKIRAGYNRRNFPAYDPTRIAPATLVGYGQLDAVDAIVNEVCWAASKIQDLDNPTAVALPADAPGELSVPLGHPATQFVEWLGFAPGGGPGAFIQSLA